MSIFEVLYVENLTSIKNLTNIFTKDLPAHAHRTLTHRLLSGNSLP
jgi:hypothetical protein